MTTFSSQPANGTLPQEELEKTLIQNLATLNDLSKQDTKMDEASKNGLIVIICDNYIALGDYEKAIKYIAMITAEQTKPFVKNKIKEIYNQFLGDSYTFYSIDIEMIVRGALED